MLEAVSNIQWGQLAVQTWCLVILSFLLLYNPKVEAQIIENEEVGFTLCPELIQRFELDKNVALDPKSIEAMAFELSQITIDAKVKENPLKYINQNVKAFATLTRIMKDVEIYNIHLSQKIVEKIGNHHTLSGDDLYQIKKGFEVYARTSDLLLSLGNMYEFKAHALTKMFAAQKMNPKVVKGHSLWLLSHLLVMEATESIHNVLYLQDSALRRIFKSTFDSRNISKEEERTLKALTEKISDVIDVVGSRKFLQQIILVKRIIPKIKTQIKNDPYALSLYDEIDNNRLTKEIAQGREDFHLNFFQVNDSFKRALDTVTNTLSGLFGNAAGGVRWRKGYLYQNDELVVRMKEKLIPMDIILEKSFFTLTDKFIPGHYGHVAIYLGTKKQLQDIGMWDHPQIIPYQKDIEAGKTILEAVRSGVRLNSIEGFMNIDEYTIIRKTDAFDSYHQFYEKITRGMQQIGKEYDFNFDISTLDKIVCSELIYIVFGNVNWPTLYRLGRPTITPDDIAEILFRKKTPFTMTDYVASTKRHKYEEVSLTDLGHIFDYELRADEGSEEKSFWKKETKCYTVLSNEESFQDREDERKKVCKTSYKEYVYDEAKEL